MASGRTHYTRANLDPNPPAMFENPNLIPRIIRRKESSLSPRALFKYQSCPVEWLFLEDLPFDEHFELYLFRTTSNSELLDLVQDPEFIRELETQRANLSIDRYLQNSTQSSLTPIEHLNFLKLLLFLLVHHYFLTLLKSIPLLPSSLHSLFNQSSLNTLPLPLVILPQPRHHLLPQLLPNLQSWPTDMLPLCFLLPHVL